MAPPNTEPDGSPGEPGSQPQPEFQPPLSADSPWPVAPSNPPPADGSGFGPPPSFGQPAPSFGQPPPAFDQPAPSFGQPAPSFGQPPPYQPPPSFDQPPPSFGQPPPFQPPGAGYQAQPYGGQPAYGYAPALPDHPSATTALVLGLVAIIGMFVCLFPILLAPFAWSTGSRAVAEIDAEPARWGGRERARAGQVLGIIGTVLIGVFIVGIVLMFLFLVAVARSS